MKNSKKLGIPKLLAFSVTILAVFLSFAAYPMLPNTVPIHWNASGEADGFGPAWSGAFIFPLVMAFVLLMFALIPKIAVFKKNLKAFEKQYWLLSLVIQLFFLIFYIVTLLPNFGFKAALSQLFSLPLAFMFIAIGLLMPSFKRNFFVGIRTPWTLASDKVWKKTHDFGGTLFLAAGIVSLALPFLIPEQAILSVVVVVLAAAIATVIYSFLEFRKLEKEGKKR